MRATARSPARRPTMSRAGVIVVALHAGAFAGQHRDADGVAGRGVAAEEAFAGGERDGGAAIARAAAFGIGDALHGHGRRLDGARAVDQRIGGRLMAVFDIEIGNGFRQALFRRQPGIFVFRREPRHRDRAFGQFGYAALGYVAGGDEGDLCADKNAQTEIGGFRALDILEFAEAAGDAGGNALDDQRVGRVRASPFGRPDQAGQNILLIGPRLRRHRIRMPLLRLRGRRRARIRRRCR
jgi:hypothetical protein